MKKHVSKCGFILPTAIVLLGALALAWAGIIVWMITAKKLAGKKLAGKE